MTDSDSYWVTDYGFRAEDQYNRRLEKSIGQFDTTHNFKLGAVCDLPFGKGPNGWLADLPRFCLAIGDSVRSTTTRAARRSDSIRASIFPSLPM